MVYPHKWSPISYRSSLGQGKFAGQDRRSTTVHFLFITHILEAFSSSFLIILVNDLIINWIDNNTMLFITESNQTFFVRSAECSDTWWVTSKLSSYLIRIKLQFIHVRQQLCACKVTLQFWICCPRAVLKSMIIDSWWLSRLFWFMSAEAGDSLPAGEEGKRSWLKVVTVKD